MEKFRARSFNLVLYEEDETHRKALDIIQKSYDYAMILHDRDIDSEGNIKKPHYHVVIRFQNPKWSTSLATELGITENYLEESRSLKRSLLYLIHFYDSDKYQYQLSDVSGSLKSRLEEFTRNEGKSEGEKILEILEEIDNVNGYIKYSLFVRHIARIGYWDVLRRSSALILRYLDEHNTDL